MGSFTPTPNPITDGASIPTTLPYKTAYGNICPVGYYCPTGTPTKICCPPGKRCTVTQLATPNQDCAAGRYCPRCTSGTGIVCPAGYYCEAKSGEPILCPAGTYNPSTGGTSISSCTLCTQGYYCPANGMTAVDTTNNKCSPGYICAAGSVHPRTVLCPKGYVCPNSPAGVWDKIPCSNDATG